MKDLCAELDGLAALIAAHPWRFLAFWIVASVIGDLIAQQILASLRAWRSRKP